MSNELILDVNAIRSALGWSQHQLAEACGVDRSTVSRWESEPPTKGPALILLRQLKEQSEGVARPETFAVPPSVTPSGRDTSPPLRGVADGRLAAEAAE